MGMLHLICSDLTCACDGVTTTSRNRWQEDAFQRSSLGSSEFFGSM